MTRDLLTLLKSAWLLKKTGERLGSVEGWVWAVAERAGLAQAWPKLGDLLVWTAVGLVVGLHGLSEQEARS